MTFFKPDSDRQFDAAAKNQTYLRKFVLTNERNYTTEKSIGDFSLLTLNLDVYDDENVKSAPINSRLNVVVWSSTPVGLDRNGCCPSRGFQLPRALPFIFSLCCPLNDRRRAAHSFFKIGRLFSFLLPLSCPSSSPHSSSSPDER